MCQYRKYRQIYAVTIGVLHSRLDLIDATTGYANPTQKLLQEVKGLYGEIEKVSTILSIGTGKLGLVNLRRSGDDAKKSAALQQLTANCEQVHQELRSRLYTSDIYFRFNCEQRTESEDVLLASVLVYLENGETSTRLDEVMKNIHGGTPKLTLKEISESIYMIVILFLTRIQLRFHQLWSL